MTKGLLPAPGCRRMTSSRNRDSAVPDVHQGLARDRLRVEPDEVDRVAGAEGEADLGIELEPTDPRALSSPRVHDDDGPLRGIDRQSLWRPDLHQGIVARSVQLATVDEDVIAEDQDRRLALGDVLQKDVAALTHHVPEQHGALDRVHQVFRPGLHEFELGRGKPRLTCCGHVVRSRRSMSVPLPALGVQKEKAAPRTCVHDTAIVTISEACPSRADRHMYYRNAGFR